MPTQTTSVKQLTTKISTLDREVSLLRSLMISIVGKDEEGVYQPDFVENILQSSSEAPTETFTDASSFMNQLNEV